MIKRRMTELNDWATIPKHIRKKIVTMQDKYNAFLTSQALLEKTIQKEYIDGEFIKTLDWLA